MPVNTERRSIVVIGAGIAGLVCAYELTDRGHEVLLLEATQRPGGRIYTERQAFSDGMFCELGAMFIRPSHHLTLSYAKKAGMILTDIPSSTIKTIHIKGKTFTEPFNECADFPVNLTSAELEVRRGTLLKRYLAHGFSMLGDPKHPNWPSSDVLRLDSLSMKEYLHWQGTSDGLMQLFTAGYFDLMGYNSPRNLDR